MEKKEALIKKFKEALQNAQRPVYIFDGDTDGLSSFLLLYHFVKEGKGIMQKLHVTYNEPFIDKINSYHPDVIFILDKPVVEQEFIDACKAPVFYLDHHPVQQVTGCTYFNPRMFNDEDNSCTAYWAYELAGGPLWIAMTGIIGDWQTHHLAEFKKAYPGVIPPSVTKQEDIYLDTIWGSFVRMINFILKGPTKDVKKNIKIMTRIKEASEILEQTTSQGKFLYRYAEKIQVQYDKIRRQIKATRSPLVSHVYQDEGLSFTGDLSNELLIRYPEKTVLIGRQKGDQIAFSARNTTKDLASALKIALEGLQGSGGGHTHACGGSIIAEEFPLLKKRLSTLLS
ncbi:MAG: DHH family phosphoesterase [Candidatus Woesearchaeota archaeon]|nr:MAG: DHH family phosphoesterase [Candidatus Woesearchaeota archaeon]